MYALSQGQIFIVFFIIGICIGVIFDVFRAIRKVFDTSDFVTYIEDIIFVAIVGILFVNNLILINSGEIRFYIILAIIFGMTLYFFTISRISVKIFQFFIKFFKKIMLFPFFFKNMINKKKDFGE